MENLEQYRIDILHEDLKTCNSIIDEIRNTFSDNKQISVLSELRHWIKERHNIIDTLLRLTNIPPNTNDNYLNSYNEMGDEIDDEIGGERNNKITDFKQICKSLNNQNAINKNNRCAQIIIKEIELDIRYHYQKSAFSLGSNLLARPPTTFN